MDNILWVYSYIMLQVFQKSMPDIRFKSRNVNFQNYGTDMYDPLFSRLLSVKKKVCPQIFWIVYSHRGRFACDFEHSLLSSEVGITILLLSRVTKWNLCFAHAAGAVERAVEQYKFSQKFCAHCFCNIISFEKSGFYMSCVPLIIKTSIFVYLNLISGNFFWEIYT